MSYIYIEYTGQLIMGINPLYSYKIVINHVECTDNCKVQILASNYIVFDLVHKSRWQRENLFS